MTSAASATSAPILRLDRVSMAFDGRTVLDDVSLAFEPGEIHGLVGHNGSGKSTLIRIAAGYYRPSAGSISVGIEDVPTGSPQVCHQRGLRFVHQELGLIPEFTALENVGLGAGYSQTWRGTVDWRAQRRRLHTALELLETSLPGNLPVSEFSAVQRAVLAIARAIAPAADGSAVRFLMLDEPTTALEGPETDRLFDVVRRLADRGVGVLYVSHQLDEVADLSDVITVLRDGQVVETMLRADVTHERVVGAMLGGEELSHDHFPALGVKRSGRPAAPLLSLRGLSSSQLRGVDITVATGECVGVVGLSGSGREELVYAISGAVSAVVESIEVEGRQVSQLKPRTCREHGIALIPGNRLPGSIVKDFTIQENLSFASMKAVTGRNGLLQHRKERRLASTWIEKFDIRPNIPTYQCRHLSGGNKQKVILAKWLATSPKMLLLDEPTAGVDIGAARSILENLRSLVDGGLSVLMTTSELSDVLNIADRVLVFSRGHVVANLVQGQDEWSEEAIVRTMTGVLAAFVGVPVDKNESTVDGHE